MKFLKTFFIFLRRFFSNVALKTKMLAFLLWLYFGFSFAFFNTHSVVIKIPFCDKEFFAPAWLFFITSYPFFSVFLSLFNGIKVPR